MSTKQVTQPYGWKRFFNEAQLNAYVGKHGESIVNMSGDVMEVRICDGVTPGCHIVGRANIGTVDSMILPPVITGPADGTTDVPTSPVLTASEFSSASPENTHATSIWTIYSDAALSQVVWTSGEDTVNLTSIDLDGKVELADEVQYWVTVTYIGSAGNEVTSMASTFYVPKTLYVHEYINQITSTHAVKLLELSSDGSLLCVGSSDSNNDSKGAVSVYRKREDGTFAYVQVLRGNDLAYLDHFGVWAVSISADNSRIAISSFYLRTTAPDPSTTRYYGKVYIFDLNEGTGKYIQSSSFISPHYYPDSYFGATLKFIDISGNSLAVGQWGTSSLNSMKSVGVLTKHDFNGTTWAHIGTIRPPESTGAGISSSHVYDYFTGLLEVSLTGGYLLVGSRYYYADIVDISNGRFEIVDRLDYRDPNHPTKKFGNVGYPFTYFTLEISGDGKTIFLGEDEAYSYDPVTGTNYTVKKGRIKEYHNDGSGWKFVRLIADNTLLGDEVVSFGIGCNVRTNYDGSRLIVTDASQRVAVLDKNEDGAWQITKRWVAKQQNNSGSWYWGGTSSIGNVLEYHGETETLIFTNRDNVIEFYN